MRMMWFRVLMMTISLVFVVLAIRNLNRNGVNPHVASIFGATGEAGVSLPGKLNWCETRVESLRLANGTEIKQEGLKWYKSSGAEKMEMDHLAVEKWFGAHCTVESELTKAVGAEIPSRLLTVGFIKGEPKVLMRYPTGEFVWGEQTLKSPDLAAALQELEQLPTVGPTSVDKQ